ncbi:MAG: sigma-54-dependent Fis family transcriptional regulator [Desulfobacterales bacterium]|uniref:Sigma-54-dependent Fis family transcriptional regulator n=1 Tax=Candidatus Desulfatibia profunda TaxID=2841695 RepID=A0A8J6NK96_9BACT|nr:sigma-54-dependent Fis family transcriptional regulator [Candidatus Desulfatibia profunda]MBL7180198.1 sigma-54-dependent Fis family transcriptional regulator [Desulfobacterales bacterium]
MSIDNPLILVIDDELPICRNCEKILSKINYEVKYALNGYDALKIMDETQFDVVITDLKMSNLGGMEVLRRVKAYHPETMVIVITGYASVSSAVEVMKLGAFDYLPKPFTPHELRAVVHQALAEREILLQNQKLMHTKGRGKPFSHQLIGSSPKIKQVISMVQKVAPTDSTVLVYGESGTGKELISRAVHANSARKNEVFFAVDCGTLSGNLLESELFGYTKGAFTGAHQNKDGIFKLAHRGTVFLDEISNTSLNVQSKLLRFLESREFMPLGSTSIQKVDVRLIFATNRHLKEMVEEGAFREDFYYRIYVYPIMIPPLRERKTDILPIAYYFLKQFGDLLSKNITGFDDNAVNHLIAYDWPGNVRQLRNIIERAAILCEKDQITLKELPFLGDSGDIEELIDAIPATNEELKQVKKEIRQKAIMKVEKSFVLNALQASDRNVTRAAQQVGLQRTNFQNLMKKHNIKLPRSDTSE